MKKEIIETGRSVEEAINSACEKLGCDRYDCEWEIIDLPKKGFLGLKNIPAKVRVSIDIPEEKPKTATAKAAPRRQESGRQSKAAGHRREQSQQPAREQQAPQAKKEAPPKEPQARQADVRPNRDDSVPVRQEQESAPAQMTDEMQAKSQIAMDYLTAVLAGMGLSPSMSASAEEKGVCINVRGDGLGAIIGRRGETLDALQYLTGLVANRMEGEYLRISVDCGDYRVKRKATLEALARKLSGQVLKANVSKTLEPMNPFERRIIHATVSSIEGVTSTSIGEEPNRRVVISSPTARAGRVPKPGGYNRERSSDRSRPPRRSGPDGPRDSRGPRRDRGPRSERPAPVQPTEPPANPPTEASDKPLYSKIDLE